MLFTRSRKDLADADRADGVDRSGSLSGGFHRERQFGGGQEGVPAIGHEHGAGVAAFAFELEPQSGGGCDGSDDAEGDTGALQQGALLDVQFHEGVIVRGGQLHRRERAGEAGGGAHLIEACAIAVVESSGAREIECTGKQTAAETADAKARGFFRSEEEQFDGAAGANAGALQHAYCFQRAEHSHRAIEASGMRNGVDVRAASHRGQLGRGSGPACESVAHRILANVESGLGTEILEPGAGLAIGLREDNSGDCGGGSIGEGGERIQFLYDLAFTNVELHLVTSGWRFQSL